MNDSKSIALSLTPEWLDGYCSDLMRRTSAMDKRVTALDALHTFIAVAADAGAQATSGYTAIRATLTRHLDKARAELLQEYAGRLAAALRQHQVTQAGSIFSALSRDGFWQLLGQVEGILDPRLCDEVVAWCRQWLAETQRRAAVHSPYPDAIDFKASGIDLTEYLMMSDISKFFAITRDSRG